MTDGAGSRCACGAPLPPVSGAPGEARRLVCGACAAEAVFVVPIALDRPPASFLSELPPSVEPAESLPTGFETSLHVGATQPFAASPPVSEPPPSGTAALDAASLAPPELPAGRRAFLLVVGAAAGTERIAIASARTTFGREGADVVLEDPALSGLHFQIDAIGDDFFLRDLGSRNGTLQNGARIRYSELLAGDEIRAGSRCFVFRTERDGLGARPASPPAPPPPPPPSPPPPPPPAADPAPRPAAPPDEGSTALRRARAKTQAEMQAELSRLVGGSAPRPSGSAAAAGVEGPASPSELMATRVSASHSPALSPDALHRDPLRIRLVLREGEVETELPVRKVRTLIGRSAVDVVLHDPLASQRHAEITIESPGIWLVKDLASTNGTRLNGRPVTVGRLAPGDRIEIGTTAIRFLVD